MITTGMMTSNKDDWETPQWLFDELNKEFYFNVDVCANKDNKKHINYFNKDQNGLQQEWFRYKTCYMNPPYGREIGGWVAKAFNESLLGATVVALLPARTDTRWFHDYIYGKAEIRFLKGRLKFSDSENSAPFPSMIVIWNKRLT